MAINKKFYEYDMRDDFSIPVYVGYDLIKCGKIEGVNPQRRVAGQLIRKSGQTYLELADFPRKKGYESSETGIVYDEEDKIANHNDGGTWYACTWDGTLQFIIRKYFRVKYTEHFATNHFTNSTSRWLVTDYSITSQLMLPIKVSSMELSLDYVYAWFNIFHPEQDRTKNKPLIFKNLTFENQNFMLVVVANRKEKHELHEFQKTAYMSIKVIFKNEQTRDFTYQLAVTIRNFFQILTGKSIGISRIILNSNIQRDPNKQGMLLKDERENWFLDQSFLPDKVNEKNLTFDVPYRDISANFEYILKQYLIDAKLQQFISNFLIIDQFRIPVNTQIVTLISAVESYYNEAKYSNGKPIQSAINKLQRLGELIEDPNDFLKKNSIHGRATDISSLFQEMIDARDYIVHGVKIKKYTSEADLFPDLIIFKKLIQTAIIRIVLIQIESNNE